jgi:signal transduction histidine kinase
VALVQLVFVIMTIVVSATVGWEPTTAGGYFAMFGNNRVEAFLRLDFPTMIQLSLFPITAFGIYAALRRTHGAYAALAATLVIIGITLALANNSAFSMIRISDQYAQASSEAQRDQLWAAAEAVVATDMWRSTAGFLAGLFMQGGLAFISIVMLRSERFSKGTAIAGLVANGLDWIHVLVALFSPSLAQTLMVIAGPAYLLWFPLLGRDLLRQGSSASGKEAIREAEALTSNPV